MPDRSLITKYPSMLTIDPKVARCCIPMFIAP
jgi:hypothetical protein